MARVGVVGGAYQAENLSADAQACINMYVEADESQVGKSAASLLDRHGRKLFANLGGNANRAGVEINGLMFSVRDGALFEINKDGTFTNLGAVADDGLPASFAASAIQVMIAAGGQGYCLTLAGRVLSPAIATIAGVNQVGYTDGYFLALIANSATIYVSNPLDGTTWQAGNKAIVSVFPGNVQGMLVDHREIVLIGNRQSVGYYDSGNTFPYDVIPSSSMEQGGAAAFGRSRADNSFFWWGQNEHGDRVAWRAQGWTPARISTHAIEAALKKYSTVADAESFTFQDSGHTFWVTCFPTANHTWVYDVATGLWSEWAEWDKVNAVYNAWRARWHVYAFGKHLVGDWKSGNIYEISRPVLVNGQWTFCDDAGVPMRRVRRSPYIDSAQQWMSFVELELEAETGIANANLNGDGTFSAGADPMIALRWSNDRGKTYGPERLISMGRLGEHGKRLITRRLGRCWGTIGRIFELVFSEPIPLRIADVHVTAAPDFGPTPRLVSTIRKGA